jgi:hypothetical protein
MASKLRAKTAVVVAAVAGIATSVLAGAPAQAASTSCSLGYGTGTGSCQSVYMNSNYTGHFMDYQVCGGQLGVVWRIRDYNSQVVVRSGSITSANQCKTGRVNGLYSIYRVELEGPKAGASGYIDNV